MEPSNNQPFFQNEMINSQYNPMICNAEAGFSNGIPTNPMFNDVHSNGFNGNYPYVNNFYYPMECFPPNVFDPTFGSNNLNQAELINAGYFDQQIIHSFDNGCNSQLSSTPFTCYKNATATPQPTSMPPPPPTSEPNVKEQTEGNSLPQMKMQKNAPSAFHKNSQQSMWYSESQALNRDMLQQPTNSHSHFQNWRPGQREMEYHPTNNYDHFQGRRPGRREDYDFYYHPPIPPPYPYNQNPPPPTFCNIPPYPHYNRDESPYRPSDNYSPSRFGNRLPGDKQDRKSDSSKQERSGRSRKRERATVPVNNSVPDIESVIDVDEAIKSLKSSYIQSTQHGNMYERILRDDSTVVGTKKLQELYNRFEKQLSNRHKNLWKPSENACSREGADEIAKCKEIQNVITHKMNKTVVVTLESLNSFDSSIKFTRHQQVKASMVAKKMLSSALEQNLSFGDYITKFHPTVPYFCLGKLKAALETGDVDADSKETKGDEPGLFLLNIKKLRAHPDRLHEELWYNEPGQCNDGRLCRCDLDARKNGIRHGIYPGEPLPPACFQMKNNIGKLYHYRIMVGPAVNFMHSMPTLISHNDHDYMFEGFSIFSHEPLDSIPFCDIIRFHIRYTIFLIEETAPENFCMKGLDLFHDYFFGEVLELYDWQQRDPKYPANTETKNFQKFRFYPRFVRALPDNGKEILSLCKVLEYLLEEDKPLVDESELDELLRCSHDDWLDYTDKVRGMIVTYPGKKPSCLRVDQLDRYDRNPVEKDSQILPIDDRYPLIVHFGIRPANLSYAGDPAYQRIWKSYTKLRHLLVNAPRVKPSDRKKLQEREEAMLKIRKNKEMQREVTVELSSKGFRRTGIFSDMCQHALLLPVLTHHLRYYLCLSNLEETIQYRFKERKWLNHAMNHPSSKMHFGLNPDHVRNALSNCGLRLPKYGDSSIHYKYTRKRGITNLIRIMARLGQQRPVLSPIEHNERLEFLGDAVVGYFTTVHLFHLFPELSEGSLTTFRTVLVNNLHLATLAERLHLDHYMLYSHGPDLCQKADLRHAMANCFEALMGAIFMEAGLDVVQKLFRKFLWETTELQNIWQDFPLHPLQEEEPESDRHHIENVSILKKLTKFEESIGVQFNHIRLLAKAFTWRTVHENVLTHGNNQRLEFLGDSVCNLVASEYLFRFYPTHHEGHLTLLRATMVNGQTQSLVATELGMPEYVIAGPETDRIMDWKVKNLADLLESFVAALYLDKGIKYVEGFMQVCFFPRLKEFILTQEWNDPKSCLQQCCLTLRQEGKEPQLPQYEVSNQGGPSHAKSFKVTVFFLGKEIGHGDGESIQKAERNAARDALDNYNFPQLEWQRRYVAQKHAIPYKSSKKAEEAGQETENINHQVSKKPRKSS